MNAMSISKYESPRPKGWPATVWYCLGRAVPARLPARDDGAAGGVGERPEHGIRIIHDMTRVAEKTGLERTHLYRKLKQLGVDLSRGKRQAGN